jgi:hypothetical protein
MSKSTRLVQLGGVSLLAIAAASVASVVSPTTALACNATPTFGTALGQVNSVTVDCVLPIDTQTFQTSVATGADSLVDDGSGPPFLTPINYDGAGDDVFNMADGRILNDPLLDPPVLVLDNQSPPEYVDIQGELDTSTGFIELLNGNDTVNMTGGELGTELDPVSIALGDQATSGLGNDADVFNQSGGTVWGGVFGLGGGNTYNLSGDAVINGQLFAGSQDDTVNISGDAIIRGVNGFSDPTAVGLEDGDDVFNMTGGTIVGKLDAGSGNDLVSVSGSAQIGTGQTTPNFDFGVAMGEGDDTVEIAGGDIRGQIDLDEGNDLFSMSSGILRQWVAALDGDDTINVSGDAVIGTGTPPSGFFTGLFGDSGDDVINVSGGTIIGQVGGGTGDDAITISGGSVSGFVFGDIGDDTFLISGGSIAGDVTGDGGIDEVTVTGGSIGGGINAESVSLFGGTITGDIIGLSGNTLVIEDPDGNLNLRDGVLFSGTNAVGTISNTDLTGGARNFQGFSSLTLNNSQLAFGPGILAEIDQLSVLGGSTLFSNGDFSIQAQGPGLGNLNVSGATINLVDNDPNDVLRVQNLTLNGATLAIDVNQTEGLSDRLTAAALVSNGTNTIAVNLLGTPVLSTATDIPVIVSGDQTGTGTFVVTGIPDSAAALYNYSIVPDGAGGFVLRAEPSGIGLGATTNIAIDSQVPVLVTDTVNDLTGDAIDSAMGLGANSGIAITPTFAVFASGQFARVDHDGFTVSSDSFVGTGPDFTANDFSAAASLDFNAAKHFGFDTKYGLNLGLFGGYTNSDVDLGSFQGFSHVGDATNASGMFGAYGLFRQDVNYLLVSATGFWGNTDIHNDVFDSNGSYDTSGYAVTASVGRIFALNDRVRFDLRGGILGVHFEGDDYTDSAGINYGSSKVSFGAVKFEPGIYADYKWDNGMVFSPYLRGELQERFSYTNEGTIDTVNYNFEDSNFSGGLAAGFNLRTTSQFTVSSEVRGKWSDDASTISAKLGVKVTF